MTRPYVSNKDESVRIFKSNFMEFFTHIHPLTPHVLFLPVVGYMLFLTVRHGLGFGLAAGLFLGGLAAWSLMEYLVHRFVFHYAPKNKLGKAIWFIMHGVHHDYPNDSRRLVMSPGISIPVAAAVYLLARLAWGPVLVAPFFAGMAVGYLGYDTLHYAVHKLPLKGRLGTFLKRYHLRHHFVNPEKGFGVSTPIWDFVFGTFLPGPRDKL